MKSSCLGVIYKKMFVFVGPDNIFNDKKWQITVFHNTPYFSVFSKRADINLAHLVSDTKPEREVNNNNNNNNNRLGLHTI